MARPGISYEAVAQAASALLASDQNPTVQRVREHLGSGSHSTIAAHLRRFHASDDQSSPEPPAPAAFDQICQQLWSQAMALAEASFEDQRQALLQREAEHLADREELLRRYQWLRATLSQREAELSAHQLSLKTHEQALAEQSAAHQSLTRELAQAYQQLEVAQQRVAATEAQSQRAQTLLREEALRQQQSLQDQLAEERQRAETEQQRQLLDIDRLRVALDSLRREADTTREQGQSRERRFQEEIHQLVRGRALSESRATTLAQAQEQLNRERDQLAEALGNARRVIIQLRERLARRSGATTTPRSDGIQGGSTGGMNRH